MRGLLICLAVIAPLARDDQASDLTERLRQVDPIVLPDNRAYQAFQSDQKERLVAAALRENAAWDQVRDQASWRAYRDPRLAALRRSLGAFPSVKAPRWRMTGEVPGDGFVIENVVIETRPGLVVAANLYRPARRDPDRRMPGFLIVHSHHAPKTQGELQDMGMTWARQGCTVLVPDQPGHGERRQHPFVTEADHPGPFRVGRQDYYFRQNTAAQLHLVGESLMGWMVWDLMRCLDVLQARPGVDGAKLIVLGAVAGGGDPAGVLAALDERVAAVAPFNFGGPQPDYPVPANPARDFYFFGVPSWESTRSLRLGARDGFSQWTIVAGVAPRRLVYAHEFAWDEPRDPIWPRIQRVFGLFGSSEHLATTVGRGELRGQPPESSHCTNIGPLHREGLHRAFARWFDLPVPKEYSRRLPADQLLTATPESRAEFASLPVHRLADAIAQTSLTTVQERLARLDATERRATLRALWSERLGDVEPDAPAREIARAVEAGNGLKVERLKLEVESNLPVPAMLISREMEVGRRPAVVAVARAGKGAFLKERGEALAVLLEAGVRVALVDVRDTGETRAPGDDRGFRGAATSRSAGEWLLGQTVLGHQLRDVRSVIAYVKRREDVDATRLAVWGDSFATTNDEGRATRVPLDAEPGPARAEPMGGLLALLAGLFEPELKAVAARGGPVSYRSLLQSPFMHVPHDALVPDVMNAGDLSALVEALAPKAVRVVGEVDGEDRRVGGKGRAGTDVAPAVLAGWLRDQLAAP